MREVVKSKFVKSEGYVINIEKEWDVFVIVNTQRKQNGDRDGIGYNMEVFDMLEKAEEYLNNL